MGLIYPNGHTFSAKMVVAGVKLFLVLASQGRKPGHQTKYTDQMLRLTKGAVMQNETDVYLYAINW